MDATTELLKDYLFDKGIQLKNLSEKANIPYSTLRDVFCNKKSKRSLRAAEFMRVCHFLELDPMKFYSDKIEMDE